MFKRLDRKLQGEPDRDISILLISIGMLFILVALFAPRLFKLPVAVWAVG